jgi:hypothetical protein
MQGIFTIILQLGEASSVSQQNANNVEEALDLWLAKLEKDVTILSAKEIAQMRANLSNDTPTPLDGPQQVWYINTSIENGHAQIHIIKTAGLGGDHEK